MKAVTQVPVSLRRPSGDRGFSPKSRFGPLGLAVMVGAHLVIGYALATGLAGKVVTIMKKPLDATIIQEVKLPPPPPPPKQIVKQEVPKTLAPPPPAYVPPPDVTPPVAATTAITAVQSVEPVAPPPAQPAPAAPIVAAGAVRTEISVACPRQIKPEVPQRAIEDGVEGTVKAEVRVRGGRVVDIKIVSGPRVFYAAVLAAISRYECSSGGDAEVVAFQDFTFKLD
jgi:periplasmic protein TonB